MARLLQLAPVLTLVLSGQLAFAGAHTAAECREGADFIRNAALARNNGQSRQAFMERLVGDLRAIRGLPLKLRWFARDRADELLLIRHAERVFDQPALPDAHAAGFVQECNRQLGDDIEIDPDAI